MASKLHASGMKKAVITLSFMLDFVDDSGWTCISRVRIAKGTGVDARTVQRHWAEAREKGFLISYDYPPEMRRTSDHWLVWPGLRQPNEDPGLHALAAIFPSNVDHGFIPFVESPGLPPF
ncbi:hypothetical protein [Arthrobacter sp. NPDC092385]|uniref:hypothetical protein n=1 Tax=Arthrobacter sp. NPDC092385 TaxID=3363943 RepID=UPI00382E1DFC